MSPEKQREIASKGGRAAHEKGTAHEWTADEARNAGRKGGQVSRGGQRERSDRVFRDIHGNEHTDSSHAVLVDGHGRRHATGDHDLLRRHWIVVCSDR